MIIINLIKNNYLILLLLLMFMMTSMLSFAQSKEDIAQISLKISSFENLSTDEKEELQENILRMVYFFDLDTAQVRQRLDNIEISDDVDQDDIILEFASQLNISLEELDQVYDDLDDNGEDDDLDDMDNMDDNGEDDDVDDMDDMDDNNDEEDNDMDSDDDIDDDSDDENDDSDGEEDEDDLDDDNGDDDDMDD